MDKGLILGAAITNPAAESAMLDNLLPFTSYQLVIRTTNTTETFMQTDTIYFSTSGLGLIIFTVVITISIRGHCF